jgi:hypothetical protein
VVTEKVLGKKRLQFYFGGKEGKGGREIEGTRR